MKKERYSAKQLCAMYRNKYIAVNHISKNKDNLIIGAEIVKVYDTLDDCKQNIAEIKFLKAIHKDDYDIIYGDYRDYVTKRTSVDLDAFIPLVY